MKLDTTILKHVLAFDHETTIVWRDLPAGLVALAGPIGLGKTTLMEAPFAALFRQFPSREKKPPYAYATATDAFIQQTFELEGRGLYRARLNLDGPRGKQEAVLTRREPDGSDIFLSASQSLDNYDFAVAALLPPLSDLLASVLAVQTKRGAFSELDRKGRRELLQSLLGLDAWEVRAERARAAADRTQREIDRLTIAHEELARDAGPEVDAAHRRRADDLHARIGAVDVRRAQLRQQIAEAEADLAQYEGDDRRYAAAKATHDQQTVALARALEERANVQTALDRHQREGQADRQRLIDRHEQWLDRNTAAQADTSAYEAEIARIAAAKAAVLDDAHNRIHANRGLLDDAVAIRAAAALLQDLDAEQATQTETARQAATEMEGHRTADRILAKTLDEIERKEAELDRAREGAARILKAPFQEQCEPCEFMTSAAAAKGRIPALEEAVLARATVEAERIELAGKLAAAKARYQTATEALDTLTRRRGAVVEKAQLLPHLTQAEEKIRGYEHAIAVAERRYSDDLAAATARTNAQIEQLQRERRNREEEHAGALTVFDERDAARVRDLEDQIARLNDAITAATWERDQAAEAAAMTVDAHQHAEAAQRRLATYRDEWEATATEVGALAAQQKDLQEQAAQLARRRMRLADLTARLTALETDLVEWQQLAKACGRDGLPTLEIDAAGPRLTELFNDLMFTCYGGRFTGELVTQQPKKTAGRDGSTHKEVVEFKVYDQKKGGAERDLTDLSGGQKILVEECLRSAIALYINARSPFPIRTCFRDETTGSLDPDTAVRYIAMLRRMRDIGGFHQLVFVTHSDVCRSLADVQLVFYDEGQFTIVHPPYGDAAADAGPVWADVAAAS